MRRDSKMEATQSLIPVEDIQALVSTAPEALARNEQSVLRARQMGETLLARLQSEGMSAQLDAEMNSYLVKIRVTLEQMKSRRAPLTQFLTKITKTFTALESQVDRDEKGSISNQIQKARDEYAAFCREEEKKAAQAAELEKQKSIEAIDIRSKCDAFFNSIQQTTLNSELRGLQAIFDRVTLDNFDASFDSIKSYPTALSYDHFMNESPRITARFFSEPFVLETINQSRDKVYDALKDAHADAIKDLRTRIIDQLPGKKIALDAAYKLEQERIALEKARKLAEEQAAQAKSVEEAKKAQQLQEQLAEQQRLADIEAAKKAEQDNEKRIAEELRLKREEDDRATKAAAELELAKSVDTANTLFDQAANAATPINTEAQVREGISIVVNAQPGWLLIVQAWFQIEGSKLAMDKFEKKTLLQMKSIVEKHQLKSGERIESPLLTYTDVFKTVAKA